MNRPVFSSRQPETVFRLLFNYLKGLDMQSEHYLDLAKNGFLIIRNLSVNSAGQSETEIIENLAIIGMLSDVLHNIPKRSETNKFVEDVLIRERLAQFISDYPQYADRLDRFIRG